MQAAKKGREEQLRVLDQYMSGELTEFVSHQGKVFQDTLDEAVWQRDRVPVKIKFDVSSILLDAAARSDTEMVTKLLGEGAAANSSNADGLTALHQCCIENSLKTARTLVDAGADINQRDNDWWTPLHAAAACGHWRIVNYLLSQGADAMLVNADGDLPIDIVEGEKTGQYLEAEMERLGMAEDELEEVRKRPEVEFTKVVEELIASGADLNKPDDAGVVPLHVACCNNYVDCLDMLIKAGVDLNVQDADGETGLHLAAFFQNYKIVEMLGRANADPEVRNRHKETPIILTEDATMIRLIKAMRENTKLDSINPAALQERDRLGSSSVHRRTTLQKHAMAKMDIQAEFKKIESQYAELEFGKKDADDAADTPKKKGSKEAAVVYSDLDFEAAGAAAGKGDSGDSDLTRKSSAEKKRIAAMYATPVQRANEAAAMAKTDSASSGGSMPKGEPAAKGGCCVIS